ncbi:McrC family protein [Egicoccus halophilus]|uniref:5-methylcytosine-specific restriction enzyme subunit McrC n=1 Tax=Egicoccus halophilus TaxID=1670830 RepID=A0A8J3EVS3_9ACTN|nr:hypothetical protein [Egicoccus halophilus]GGI08735.1 hypothetical protein GCM10011354_30570 [Egicoccus halophilus]
MAEHVPLREYQPTGPTRLSAAERDALLAASVTVTPVSGTTDLYEVRPGSTVGVVRVRDRQFDIAPKIGIQRLLNLLTYSIRDEFWGDELAEYGRDADLLEVVAAAYALRLERTLERGVVRGYRHRAERGVAIRGRIDMAAQVRREFGRMLPINIAYDDHTIDIDPNRILLAAVLRLRSLRLRTDRTRRRLLMALDRLDGVTAVRYDPRRLPRVSSTRLDHHYRPALAMAALILSNSSVEAGTPVGSADAILFNMNEVFEDFIVGALREQLALDSRTFPQGDTRLTLDEGARVGLEPDLSWIQAGRPIFVGDVKYKRLTAAGYKHPDLYQVHAYARAAGLPSTLLVYAAGEAESAIYRVVRGGPEIEVVVIDLNRDLEGLAREMARIASRVRQHAERGRAALNLVSTSPPTTTTPVAS